MGGHIVGVGVYVRGSVVGIGGEWRIVGATMVIVRIRVAVDG